jgi:DNA mismatch repair protein MutS2
MLLRQSKYANRINGIMPTISENRTLFRDAYHPDILYVEKTK